MKAQAFVTNGSASYTGGDCYQITPDSPGQAGSIFSQNTIDLTQPFTETATFFFGCKDGSGADGIVFILALTNTGLGVGGGGLGYEGLGTSIAIEYDDYQNGNFGDPASDHMAVISMGSVDHNMGSNLAGPFNIANIEDCEDHCFYVSWDPVTQTLSATLDDEVISYTGDIVTNIFGGNANVYYGFSSGTGALSNLHTVCFGPPEVAEMPDETICIGENVQLQADPDGIAWTWSPDPTLSSYSISNPIASPSVTTTYTTIIEYACGFLGYDTVVVNVNPLPVVFADNNGPVCVDETLLLMSGDGVSYSWSGPMSFTSGNQNPQIDFVTPEMGGIYSVTVTDINGCSAETTTLVVVDEGPMVEVDPVPNPVCINLDPFQLTAMPAGGEWTGDISFDGIFDPEYVGEGVHIVYYTATNNNGCESTEEVVIEVLPIPEVLIDPPGTLCETSGPIQLTGSPPGGIWTGEITLNGIFDPGQAGDGPHLITYTANDANGCTNAADIIIEVVPGVITDITPQGPFCASDSMVQLFSDPPGGTWGGVANAMGIIFPADLGTGVHSVNYMVNDPTGCYSGQLDIEVLSNPQPVIDPVDTLCLNEPGMTLTASPLGGTWGGAADANGWIDPINLGSGDHQVNYTYTTPEGCMGADSILFHVLPSAPQIGNVNIQCDSLGDNFVVTFSISGGELSTYNIQGSTTGTLTPGTPAVFSSLPISSGSSYSFIVDDANHCDPDSIAGDYTCNCQTNAGAMDITPVIACAGDTIFVNPPSGVVLDADDTLVYVLHLGFPNNILVMTDTTYFVLESPLIPGTTYFVSSVAGNGIPGTGVDLNDPCLSVSFGTPIMWIAPPQGSISAPAEICEGESAEVEFMLTGGGGLYNVVWTDGSGFYLIDSIPSGHVENFIVPASLTITLVEVHDVDHPECAGFPGTSVTVQVNYPKLTQVDASICVGDSIYLGGQFQFDAGIYYDSLLTSVGCDSVIETSLSLLPLDTTFIQTTSCDTTQTGVFYDTYSNTSGCDSTVVTFVSYVLSDTTRVQSITCDQSAAGVFTNMFIGQGGCDSIVIETVTYWPPDTTMLSGTTCDPVLSGVFSSVFTNQLGCDSIVIETISLLPSDTTWMIDFSCEPADTGTTAQHFPNLFGCDSVVYMTTLLSMDDSCRVIEISKDVFVPNVFSPNRDGINDWFFISSAEGSVQHIDYLRIYDRWGGLVFEVLNILPNVETSGWDGMEKGKFLMPAVFVWVAQIEFSDGSTEIFSGDVTLLR